MHKSCRLIIIVLVLVGACVSCWGKQLSSQQLQCRVDSLDCQLQAISASLDMVKQNEQNVREIVSLEQASTSKAVDEIADLIAASNTDLTVWGIAIAVLTLLVGAFVSIFVSKKEQEIEKIMKDVDKEKKLLLKASHEVKEIDKRIQTNLGDLYAKLQREEVKAILHKLTQIPEDIENHMTILLSRQLMTEDFNPLNTAYEKLLSILVARKNIEMDKSNINSSYDQLIAVLDDMELRQIEEYWQLFFIYFIDKVVQDPIKMHFIVPNFGSYLDASFENEIPEFITSFVLSVSTLSSCERIELIGAYVRGILTTKYKHQESYYISLYDSLQETEYEVFYQELLKETKMAIHIDFYAKFLQSKDYKGPALQQAIDYVNQYKGQGDIS